MFNSNKNGQNLLRTLKEPKETNEPGYYNIKQGDLPTLNEYLTPVFIDMDPEQQVEDEYKRKHNQVFCWRLLRAISYIDLVNFHGRPDQQKF